MATYADLAEDALRLIGVLATSETPSSDMQVDALTVLNDMLDAWSTEKLFIYAKVREEFTLTSGQASRTIGSTGNFSTTRPAFYEAATIEDQSSSDTPETPVDIITQVEWAEIKHKAHTSAIPTKMYPEGTFPNDTLNFWPVPSAANKIVLYTLKPLSSVLSTDTISLPPGYKKAIKYNWAVDLAPEYGKVLDQSVVIQAQELKAIIKRTNLKPRLLKCDSGALGAVDYFDINEG